jgi:DNA-binding PadR family transcriptional regulator
MFIHASGKTRVSWAAMADASPVPRPRSPLWMIVLALACEEPMHPYRMQTLIKQRGKDNVANVAQRNSVYQTIDALLRAGLISVLETSRQERRPERTVYEATEQGRQALRSWIRAGISTPAREFPEFPAVLSVLYGVGGAEDLRALLESRVTALDGRLAELEKPVPGVPRLFLLEIEYMAAVVRAEVQWLRGVIADLRSRRLTFPTVEEMLRLTTQAGGPSEETVRRIAAETRSAGAAAPAGEAVAEGATRPAGQRKRTSRRGARSSGSTGAKPTSARRARSPSR